MFRGRCGCPHPLCLRSDFPCPAPLGAITDGDDDKIYCSGGDGNTYYSYEGGPEVSLTYLRKKRLKI